MTWVSTNIPWKLFYCTLDMIFCQISTASQACVVWVSHSTNQAAVTTQRSHAKTEKIKGRAKISSDQLCLYRFEHLYRWSNLMWSVWSSSLNEPQRCELWAVRRRRISESKHISTPFWIDCCSHSWPYCDHRQDVRFCSPSYLPQHLRVCLCMCVC